MNPEKVTDNATPTMGSVKEVQEEEEFVNHNMVDMYNDYMNNQFLDEGNRTYVIKT